jgi:hypothetical protein
MSGPHCDCASKKEIRWLVGLVVGVVLTVAMGFSRWASTAGTSITRLETLMEVTLQGINETALQVSKLTDHSAWIDSRVMVLESKEKDK